MTYSLKHAANLTIAAFMDGHQQHCGKSFLLEETHLGRRSVLATKNKGQIMKAVMAELKGKADGKVINQVVAKLTQ